jgi:hypothetical protein
MEANNQNPEKNQERPGHGRENETPEKRKSEQEGSGYPHEREQEQQQGGNDASYSEQVDVTPPKTHEFPSVGNAETDFRPSNHGRTTGRMVGHEPGTEGGI